MPSWFCCRAVSTRGVFCRETRRAFMASSFAAEPSARGGFSAASSGQRSSQHTMQQELDRWKPLGSVWVGTALPGRKEKCPAVEEKQHGHSCWHAAGTLFPWLA